MGIGTDFINNIFDRINNASALGRISYWLEEHTRLFGRPYSFENHEFQRDIVDSKHHNMVTIKPSQVGLTELSVREKLAFLAIEQDSVGLHLLPTRMEAQSAAKSRIDPVIESSPTLRSMLNAGSDSASFKRIGTSQLFTGGTFGKAVISIPTDHLSIDEIDFCNQENVATAEGRLSHSRFEDDRTGLRGIVRKWSTPTAVGYGVDGLYTQSDMRKRLVRHRCGHWFWPQFLQHVVVDGWDDSFDKLTHYDIIRLEAEGKVDTARILCPQCRKPVTSYDLGPEHREWVAEHPERFVLQGWHVSPFDMPSYHTPAALLRKMVRYAGNIQHFYNFALGVAHSDATNSIMREALLNNTVLAPVPPEIAESTGVSGCIAGIDIGKTSWILIGRPHFNGSISVLWAERIEVRGGKEGEDFLFERVVYLLNAYKVIKAVSDALPYTPTILSIQATRPEGWFYPNFYGLSEKKAPLWEIKEKDRTLSSHRTKTLNLMATKCNSGQIKWPKCSETDTIINHLTAIKRIDRIDETTGEESSDWVKTGDDHFAHACNYLTMASGLLEAEFGITGWAPRPSVLEATVGSQYEKESA